MHKRALIVFCGCSAFCAALVFAGDLDAKIQAKIDAQLKEVQKLAAESAVVSAVKDQNAKPSADVEAMTQDKWKSLTLTDEFVKSLAKNKAAEVLKARKGEFISEAFVSDLKGRKVAFLSKTTSWCHAGKPKHDDPLKNKTWQGEVEVDESSGVQQIQIAVPILDGDKPIGSLVVGLNITKLKKD